MICSKAPPVEPPLLNRSPKGTSRPLLQHELRKSLIASTLEGFGGARRCFVPKRCFRSRRGSPFPRSHATHATNRPPEHRPRASSRQCHDSGGMSAKTRGARRSHDDQAGVGGTLKCVAAWTSGTTPWGSHIRRSLVGLALRPGRNGRTLPQP